VWIFWFAAGQTIPALLCVFLARRGIGPRSADPDVAEGQREDETRLTWRGVKSIISDPRLLVFAA
jgi:hypothetical protein